MYPLTNSEVKPDHRWDPGLGHSASLSVAALCFEGSQKLNGVALKYKVAA